MFIQAYKLLDESVGTRGLKFGENLPNLYQLLYKIWEQDLGTVLRDKKCMPTYFLRDKAHTTGNGYHSLHAIIRKTHPFHQHEPYLQCVAYPYQGTDQSLRAFAHQWQDIFYLKKVFFEENIDLTLSSHDYTIYCVLSAF